MTAATALNKQPLGIMGGAFDPVHYGHLRSAVELQEYLGLGELRFIPSANPPHREPHIASAELRVRMLEVALEGMPGCVVDQRELHREGPSWSVLTLEEIRAEVADCSLCMILGMDAFLGLPDWHRWEELFGLAHIVVAYRPGSKAPESGVLGELIRKRGVSGPKELQAAPAGQLLLHEVTQLEISSTTVRDFLHHGRSARHLLPDAVLKIINESDCYNGSISLSKERGLHG
ncbi:MAG: nicotinate-nucleotide adenylyltransferase [Gammaproteobacteria bacterium]